MQQNPFVPSLWTTSDVIVRLITYQLWKSHTQPEHSTGIFSLPHPTYIAWITIVADGQTDGQTDRISIRGRSLEVMKWRNDFHTCRQPNFGTIIKWPLLSQRHNTCMFGSQCQQLVQARHTEPTSTRVRSQGAFDLDAESIARGQPSRPRVRTWPAWQQAPRVTRAARPLHHQSDCGWPASVTQRKIANLSSERHRHRRLRGSAAAAAAAAARRWSSATETQTRGRCRTFQSPLIYFTHCIYTYSTSSECPMLSLFLSNRNNSSSIRCFIFTQRR